MITFEIEIEGHRLTGRAFGRLALIAAWPNTSASLRRNCGEAIGWLSESR